MLSESASDWSCEEEEERRVRGRKRAAGAGGCLPVLGVRVGVGVGGLNRSQVTSLRHTGSNGCHVY